MSAALRRAAHGCVSDVAQLALAACCGAATPAWQRFKSTAAHSTTVLCVRKGSEVVIMADGQVTMGSMVLKPNVKKLRRIGDDVIGGFAGATADGMTLFERLESKLDEHPGQLVRAAVELAKAWRTDRYLRRLEASLIVADAHASFEVTGAGDVLESHDGIIAIGSGAPYALAAARALADVDGLSAMQIVRKAMSIAADSCIYTNHNFTWETLPESLKIEDSSMTAGAQDATRVVGTNKAE